MSVYARIRIILLAAVAVVSLAVWFIASQQRDAALGMRDDLRTANSLLTAMLDQETGLRGFVLTSDPSYLDLNEVGRRRFDQGLRDARRRASSPLVARLVEEQHRVAREWESEAQSAIDVVKSDGPRSTSTRSVRSRKELMDRFRARNREYRIAVEDVGEARLARARMLSSVFVLVFGVVVLGVGLTLVERQARRDRRLRAERSEFVAALQGAEDEGEAKRLLRRQIERIVPGCAAVVLARDASGNALEPATDPDAVGGLGERLNGTAPRDCLAIRRETTHERGAGEDPLQSCELCGGIASPTVCVPSVVGGEVIGSVLVAYPNGLRPRDRETLAATVTQSAPVMANLRNLAIAEHRAATDPLTRLPNARSLQEALMRMSAQAARSDASLSAVVLDIDHFKALNDRHGHVAGDEMLEAVGSVLRRSIRASDFAGRWGGEEFLLLLPDTGSEGAYELAEKLRVELEGLVVPSVPVRITGSFGAATIPDHADDGDMLLRQADRALYAAKAAGRNRVCVASGAGEPVEA
jgi:diguanylate cyclase (GGDEF)-like protein